MPTWPVSVRLIAIEIATALRRGNVRSRNLSALVLPVARFSRRNPLQCRCDAALARLIGLRRVNPFDVLALVAWRKGVERCAGFRVRPERGPEIGRHRSMPFV